MSDLEDLLAFQLRATKLPAEEREYRFHDTRKWRFDFAWPDQRVACEVEGGSWVGGAHNRGTHFEQDCEKYGEAVVLGWRILRVTGHMVEDGRAIDLIERSLGAPMRASLTATNLYESEGRRDG